MHDHLELWPRRHIQREELVPPLASGLGHFGVAQAGHVHQVDGARLALIWAGVLGVLGSL